MRSILQETITLDVPGTLKHRAVVLRTVSAACRLATGRQHDDVPEDLHTKIVTAVGEAFNNIVVHGYADRPDGRVFIQIHTDGDFLAIELTDDSAPFDFQSISGRPIGQFPESGMGVFLIMNTMDQVQYTPGPPNTLRLQKRIFRGADR